MKNSISLKKNYQFRYVYNRGKSIANRQLVMYILPNNKEYNQLGLSVSKKVGKSVIRSRITRLIKEAYRIREDNIKIGFDIVFIARNSCASSNFSEIGKSIEHLLKKQNLYVQKINKILS